MLGRKSTKDIVQAKPAAGSGAAATPEGGEKEPVKTRQIPIALAAMVRSRGFAGGLCILAGLLVAFVFTPMLQARASRTTPVLVLTQNVPVGTQVTAEMLAVEERGILNLPIGVLAEKEAAQGRFMAVAGAAGDILTAGRLTDQVVSDDPELLMLPEGKLAMSASFAALAQSVSGKLRSGDIIQIFSVEEAADQVGSYISQAVPELQRVEVLGATNSNAQDIVVGDQTPDIDRQVTTLILSVDGRQAAVLARLDSTATLYAALVTRGDPVIKEAALLQQQTLLAALEEPVLPPDGEDTSIPPPEEEPGGDSLPGEGGEAE